MLGTFLEYQNPRMKIGVSVLKINMNLPLYHKVSVCELSATVRNSSKIRLNIECTLIHYVF